MGRKKNPDSKFNHFQKVNWGKKLNTIYCQNLILTITTVPISLKLLHLLLKKVYQNLPPPAKLISYHLVTNTKRQNPLCSLKEIYIYSNLWTISSVSKIWKQPLIPLAKLIKKLYRSNRVCETFERMINHKVMWFLEANQTLKYYL